MPDLCSGRSASVSLAAVLLCLCVCSTVHAQPLPGGWATRDIGRPVLEGWTEYAGGVFDVAGAGRDTWNTSDQLRFVYQRFEGDVDFIARVDALEGADAWSKAGIMIRSSLGARAAHGFVLVSAQNGSAFQRRTVRRGSTLHTSGGADVAPCWLRLTRVGTTVTGYRSADGLRWHLIGRDTVALGATAYIGLAVSSHNESMRATARFSAVTFARAGVPPDLRSIDIGQPAVRGAATFRGTTIIVMGGGADIWDVADQFHYTYEPMSGDADVSVHVLSLRGADPWAKVELMIRASLDPGSPHASAVLSSGRGYAFQRRGQPGGLTDHTYGGAGAAPGWLRLVRQGSRFEAFRSADGTLWESMGAASIAMGPSVYVGLAVTSHDVSAVTTAVCEDLQVHVTTSGAAAAPTGIAFTASADHATLVSHYVFRVFTGGATAVDRKLVGQVDLGKPTPDASGEIVVGLRAFFEQLAPGDYEGTVAAVGATGSTTSATVSFVR